MKKMFLLSLVSLSLLAPSACADFDYNSELPIDGSVSILPEDHVDETALVTYTWPTEDGQAKLSEYYKVYVTIDGGEEIELQVIQSDPITWNEGDQKEDYQSVYTQQRTFSFASLSYDESCGKSLTFRVVSMNGISASSVEVAPASYNITPTGSGTECTFTVSDSNKYMVVNFDDASNIVDVPIAGPNSVTIDYEWIKHQLSIFIDPKETYIPNPATENIVYFTGDNSASDLTAADVIYFEPGYYNLSNYNISGVVESNGKLILQNEQAVYIAGGAFIEGYIDRINYSDTNHEIRGRGILSGRQYKWREGFYTGDYISQIAQTSKNSIIEGVTFMESPLHGVVSGEDGTYNNVKLIGWHCNNDGFRPGNRTIVKNCFLKACDDFFYDYDLEVSECVFWPAFNGSILTSGWQYFDIGGSILDDIDIVYPEWQSMGNNKGLVMSQNEYLFNPTGEGTVLRNIRFEGMIPGFVNLKPNSSYDTSTVQTGTYAPLSSISDLGYLGDLTLENVSIEEQVGEKSLGMQTNLIKGAKGVTVVADDPDAIWYVKNVTFRNVTIGGVKLTDENKDTYFNIDEETTENIVFE